MVDDDTLIREGAAARMPDLDVLPAVSVEEVLACGARFAPVDVVVVDLRLRQPGAPPVGVQGARGVAALAAAGYPTLIYTNEHRRHVLAMCLAAGARGIVHKTEPVSRLRAAVDAVVAGRVVLTPAVAGLAELVARAGRLPALTDRQREVLRARARGEPFASIARRLFISERTAEDHMSAVATKFAELLRGRSAADLERELGVGEGDLLD
jgi:DNA-binding NarL/FixJ family response regulator